MKYLLIVLIALASIGCEDSSYYGTYDLDREAMKNMIIEQVSMPREFIMEMPEFEPFMDSILAPYEFTLIIDNEEIEMRQHNDELYSSTYTYNEELISFTNDLGQVLTMRVFSDKLVLEQENDMDLVFKKR